MSKKHKKSNLELSTAKILLKVAYTELLIEVVRLLNQLLT